MARICLGCVIRAAKRKCLRFRQEASVVLWRKKGEGLMTSDLSGKVVILIICVVALFTGLALTTGFYAPPSLRQPITVGCVLMAVVSSSLIAAYARRRNRGRSETTEPVER